MESCKQHKNLTFNAAPDDIPLHSYFIVPFFWMKTQIPSIKPAWQYRCHRVRNVSISTERPTSNVLPDDTISARRQIVRCHIVLPVSGRFCSDTEQPASHSKIRLDPLILILYSWSPVTCKPSIILQYEPTSNTCTSTAKPQWHDINMLKADKFDSGIRTLNRCTQARRAAAVLVVIVSRRRDVSIRTVMITQMALHAFT